MRGPRLAFGVVWVVLLALVFTGCAGGVPLPALPSPGTVLAVATVQVGPGGGQANVPFNAVAGVRVRIMMTASQTWMEPYGYLTFPNGAGGYYPPLGTAVNGVNSVDVTLNQTGGYNLTVFDGSNQGGFVDVVVTVI